MTYVPKTVPYAHQQTYFDEHKDTASYALFWEQGLGKTKAILDNAGYLFLNQEIDALVIVAPANVHPNWASVELEKHVPDDIAKRTMGFAYHSSKAKNAGHRRKCDELLKFNGLAILAISYSGATTKAGTEYLNKFLKQRSAMMVLDESAYIKNPSAQRSKAILKIGKAAIRKRILTGTPIDNGPFDVFSQMKFLDADFWKAYGLNSFSVFKNYFAVWQEGYNPANGRTFKQVSYYQNLDKLKDMLDPGSSRLLKSDVLDLPPKIFHKRFFDMSKDQSKVYKQLRDEMYLETSEGTVTTDLAIVRLLRLQQVTCGYLAMDRDNPDTPRKLIDIDKTNPRMIALMSVLEEFPGKAIIWARFTSDIDRICATLGDLAVRYDGTVTDPDKRQRALFDFQNGDKQYFVATQQACSTGVTLTAASTVVYYTNTFRLSDRLQSEDRAHRIGQTRPVNYIDIIANNTVDTHVVDALRNKKNISDEITGDKLKEWL